MRPSRKGGWSIDSLSQIDRQALREAHDDREGHGGRANDRRADEHGLGRGLEGVAGARRSLLEQMRGALEFTSQP